MNFDCSRQLIACARLYERYEHNAEGLQHVKEILEVFEKDKEDIEKGWGDGDRKLINEIIIFW